MKTPSPKPAPAAPGHAIAPKPGTALYYQVYLNLKHRVAQGEFASGQPLPNETALAGEFGVGRVTVRRAILDMVSEGLLVRYRARGTFVTGARRKADPGVSLGEQLQAIAQETTVSVVALAALPATGLVAARLGLQAGSKVHFARRLRLRDEAPALLLDSYLPWHLGRHIRRRDLAARPLHQCLADAGVELADYTQEFSATSAPADFAEQLRIPVGSALGVLERVTLDRNRVPVEFMVAAFVPDRARFRLTASAGRGGDAGSFVYRD